VEGGEIEYRKGKMAKKGSPLATYIVVFVIFMIILALGFPTQFKQFVDAIYVVFGEYQRISQVILVLILIGLVVYLLKRLRKL